MADSPSSARSSAAARMVTQNLRWADLAEEDADFRVQRADSTTWAPTSSKFFHQCPEKSASSTAASTGSEDGFGSDSSFSLLSSSAGYQVRQKAGGPTAIPSGGLNHEGSFGSAYVSPARFEVNQSAPGWDGYSVAPPCNLNNPPWNTGPYHPENYTGSGQVGLILTKIPSSLERFEDYGWHDTDLLPNYGAGWMAPPLQPQRLPFNSTVLNHMASDVVSAASSDANLQALDARARPAVEPQLGSTQLPSVGSALHETGSCKPCLLVHAHLGCQQGANCEFCHHVHQRQKTRACKGKRDRFKKLVHRLKKEEDNSDKSHWASGASETM